MKSTIYYYDLDINQAIESYILSWVAHEYTKIWFVVRFYLLELDRLPKRLVKSNLA